MRALFSGNELNFSHFTITGKLEITRQEKAANTPVFTFQGLSRIFAMRSRKTVCTLIRIISRLRISLFLYLRFGIFYIITPKHGNIEKSK